MSRLLFQGAEALIKSNKDNLIKERKKKSYRLPLIDERLRKQRTKKEVKLLQKAYSVIHVPKVIRSSEYNIEMEYLKGEKLSDCLERTKDSEEICLKIGQNIAKLHDNDIIHGDLTTSNMILKEKKVYFIDFGLGFESKKVEDKATDLHLIKQALEARHHGRFDEFFHLVLQGYKKSKDYKAVLTQLKKVEARGRYKNQF